MFVDTRFPSIVIITTLQLIAVCVKNELCDKLFNIFFHFTVYQ